MRGDQLRASYVHATQYQRRTDVSLISESRMSEPPWKKLRKGTHRKSICSSIVMAVTMRGLRPVESAWSSKEMRAVVDSVSAAVPAPQQRMLSVMQWI